MVMLMEKLLLNQNWTFQKAGQSEWLPAVVPGCNYLDLMANGKIDDPFVGKNAEKLAWVYESDWVYRCTFDVTDAFLQHKRIFLQADCLDVYAAVELNGQTVGKTDNAYRGYDWDVTGIVHTGSNTLQITFSSFMPHIKAGKKARPLPNNANGISGSPYIRKPACHFGWDFGPILPPAGIEKDIFLAAYDEAALQDILVRQTHQDGSVQLDVTASLDHVPSAACTLELLLTDPQGREAARVSLPVSSAQAAATLNVEEPQLWWCSTLGDQPLYTLQARLLLDGHEADARDLRVGLRTITLDTSPDACGHNFCFVVNGVKIFCRGSNWIPADMFLPRLTPEKLRYRLEAMKKANMNIVRVWGGGWYESDLFYDLCDELGLLVWQDFPFACAAYPFEMAGFLENVSGEVEYNVKRLRHHACLALWCGNNEIESMSLAWAYDKAAIDHTKEFFYSTLPAWLRRLDDVTPYWACTPSSGTYMKNVNSDQYGDTHLWNVWHGMRDLDFYRKRYTRFCSEFGLESYPSMACLDRVIAKDQQYLGSDELNAHQKSADGDMRMLYYVNKLFWQPKAFSDLVYLTQITQMECIRDATEHWRRNRGRCNGSMYWQFDDCWCGSSWASMDFDGHYKPLLYAARHFNAPITLSLENSKTLVPVWLLNETLAPFDGRCDWQLETFDGTVLRRGSRGVHLKPMETVCLERLDFKSSLSGARAAESAFVARLYDGAGTLVSARRCLFRKENACRFSDPQLSVSVSGNAVTVTARHYARYVCLRADGISAPFSDNYFDLSAGESKTVYLDVPDEALNGLAEKLHVSSLYDVTPAGSRSADRLKSLQIMLKPVSIVNWIGRLFDK